MTARELNGIAQFQADNAQPRLYDYPLNSRSVVFDIGGYKGDWTYDLLKKGAGVCEHCGCKQDPYVYLFEPVHEFYTSCLSRFEEYPKVKCFNFGLYNQDCSEEIIVDEAASSIFGPAHWRQAGDKQAHKSTFQDITTFLYQRHISQIDLMSINIEGMEYALLDRVIRAGIAQYTDFIQVQFHDFVPEAIERRAYLQSRLKETHIKMFDYPFVWEAWRRRTDKEPS